MLITKEVEVRWNSTNVNHFLSKGYEFTNFRDTFMCKIEDLPPTSRVPVVVTCDYCGKEITKGYLDYRTQRKTIAKDCCNDTACMKKKRSESNIANYGVPILVNLEHVKDRMRQTNLERYGTEYAIGAKEVRQKINKSFQERYGVDNPFQIEEVKEKSKHTTLERYGKEWYTQTDEYRERYIQTCQEMYGVDNMFQAEEIKEKSMQTCLEKYGEPNYTKTEEFKERFRNFCIEHYGTENPFQCEEFKEKAKRTCLEKYGVEYAMQNEIIKANAIATLYRNGNVNTSKQQLYLHSLLGGDINKAEGRYNLDIAFPDETIYIEYDGGGHNLQVKFGTMTEKEFKKKEMDRYFYLKRRGWKMIKITSPIDYLPSDEIILNEIQKAKQWFSIDGFGHSHYNIDIGRNADDEHFGKLHFVS
jgi:very-short-patch-repair endonuclease